MRWNSKQSDLRLFTLSVALITAYYHIQILVHNPFIKWTPNSGSYVLRSTSTGGQTFSNTGPNFARSVVICTNAALACCDILEAQLKRATDGVIFVPTQISGAFASAVFLLVILYGTKANKDALCGVRIDPTRAMRAVRVSLDVIGKMSKSGILGKSAWYVVITLKVKSP